MTCNSVFVHLQAADRLILLAYLTVMLTQAIFFCFLRFFRVFLKVICVVGVFEGEDFEVEGLLAYWQVSLFTRIEAVLRTHAAKIHQVLRV